MTTDGAESIHGSYTTPRRTDDRGLRGWGWGAIDARRVGDSLRLHIVTQYRTRERVRIIVLRVLVFRENKTTKRVGTHKISTRRTRLTFEKDEKDDE